MIHSYSNRAEEAEQSIGFLKYLVIEHSSSNSYGYVEIKTLIRYISLFQKAQERQHDILKRILLSLMAQGGFDNGLLFTEYELKTQVLLAWVCRCSETHSFLVKWDWSPLPRLPPRQVMRITRESPHGCFKKL